VTQRLFTSESVTEGHPDKVCDQVSDAVLDAVLEEDPNARVAVESLATAGLVVVSGEMTTDAYVEIPDIVRGTIAGIGYTSPDCGFDGEDCGVSVLINPQSPDIALGVDSATDGGPFDGEEALDENLGAGDQGLMFGYACRETPELMPIPIMVAHALTRRLAEARRSGEGPFLRPDGKAQATIGYDGDRPTTVHTIVLSTQHTPDIATDDLRAFVEESVVAPVLASFDLDPAGHRSLINPTGRFEKGGPKADAGLTGRKIIVDTYGGAARHGGGAFSGKDPSKVDRSASYALRWIAKNIVAAGLADRIEIQIAYSIGAAHPIGMHLETFGTESAAPDRILSAIREVFDLRPSAIIKALDLRRPIYLPTAAYGHFGREGFPWEETDRVADLRSAVG
jgi:S-adenosylmethionine synthetase